MKLWRGIGIGLAVCGVAALGAGFGGRFSPVLDSWAVFRIPIAVALLLLLPMLRRPWWFVLPGIVLASVAFGPRVWAAWGPQPAVEQAQLRVYQKNLLFRLPTPALVIADIRARAPDIVTVQEVSRPNQAILAELRDAYPAQNYCHFRQVGGPAVLSRWPMVEGSAVCGPGFAGMQVETPGGRLWAISVHLRWPWPFPQPEQVKLLVPVLEDLSGPKVIGGDFNNIAWSDALARVEAASGTHRVGREAVTFALPYGGLGVGIDHVLASPPLAGRITVLERLGSDHRGLLADLAPMP